MNKAYKLIFAVFVFFFSVVLLTSIPSVSSNDTLKINTFLVYEDSTSATSKTVTQGDSFNVVMVAYGHGEALQYEKLDLVGSATIFKEYVSGDKINTYTWLYTKTYTVNSGILVPGTYTLRFTARTVNGNEEYSDLQLTILPKTNPIVCGNGIKEGTEQCDYGSSNGQVCNPLYGSSCQYCSTQCKLITLKGPYCGDGTCSNGETCESCPTDCGVCPDNIKPVVDITNPIATTYTSHRTSLTFNVQDDNLKSCSYKLNNNPSVTMQSVSNGVNVVTGITSVVGTNTWAVTCVDYSGNVGSDSVTFTVTLPPVCGNGKLEAGEQCDYGSSNGQVCNPLYGSSCQYCSTQCKLITLKGPYCGDGIKQSNEECDDGNNVNGDGCSATCKIEETKECVLQLTKSVNDTDVKVGDMVSFTLKYKNVGNGACTGGGVKVQDILNPKFKVIAYSANVKDDIDKQGISFGYSSIPDYDSSTNTLTFNAHTVSPGEEGIIMIGAKVLEPSKCGDFQISNQFKVWSNEKGWQNSNTVTVYVDNDCYTPVCGNGKLEAGEQCDYGSSNGQVCNPLYGGSCQYCSTQCKLITLKGPYCGDGTCSNGETCESCPTDCGVCPDNIKPVVNIINPINTTYTSHRTNLTFSVYDDNLKSCTYKLNDVPQANVLSLKNGVNIITGITSVMGINTWTVTCVDYSGNVGSDSVTFTVKKGCTSCCGDGICDPSAGETCSTCPYDCGVCPKECTTCKDSKPLDDRYYTPTGKVTIVHDDSDDLPNKQEKSLKANKTPLIALILIAGILILLILVIIIRLTRR